MELFRVFPYVESASHDEPGGAFFIPAQGLGRIDNPDFYRVLYLGDSAEGAIAETFARFRIWSPDMLGGTSALPKSVFALARYSVGESVAQGVCDLDDPGRLVDLRLRPSKVVTTIRAVSQAWALHIFEQTRWSGVRWWSYYDSRWMSYGIWSKAVFKAGVTVEPLTIRDARVAAAAEVVNRMVRLKN